MFSTEKRRSKRIFVIIVLITNFALSSVAQKYDTSGWSTLKNYQTPEWFRDAKFGIYPHWGVYSVPEFGNEWYGYAMYDSLSQSPNYVPKSMYPHHVKMYGSPRLFGYKDFIPLFRAEKFNADQLMSEIAYAGAKYFAHLTSHHDSFLMYGSKLSRWNCVEMGPKIDVGLAFQAAAKKYGLKFGISNHLAENDWFFQFNWHNKFDAVQDTSLSDLYNDYNESIDLNNTAPSDKWLKRWTAISKEMIDYFKPDYVYYDRGWSMHPKWTPYRKELAAYQYNKAIEWGRGVFGKPGVALLYKDEGIIAGGAILDHENGIPGTLQELPFQCDQSISQNSWGYVANETYWPTSYLINRLVDIVSKNGNMMLSINPKADGTLPDSTRIRLKQIGDWIAINGEAIYASRPAGIYGSDKPDKIRFTTSKNKSSLYVFSELWPADGGILEVPGYTDAVSGSRNIHKITLLGSRKPLKFSQSGQSLRITTPKLKPLNCNYNYVFKVELE